RNTPVGLPARACRAPALAAGGRGARGERAPAGVQSARASAYPRGSLDGGANPLDGLRGPDRRGRGAVPPSCAAPARPADLDCVRSDAWRPGVANLGRRYAGPLVHLERRDPAGPATRYERSLSVRAAPELYRTATHVCRRLLPAPELQGRR